MSAGKEVIEAMMMAAAEVERLRIENRKLQKVMELAAYIVLNRKNFVDKHPAIKDDANAILDELAAALRELNVTI